MRTLKPGPSLSRPVSEGAKLLQEAESAVERGDAERARQLAAQAFAAEPSNPRARDLHMSLQLARAVRLAAAARDARRREIATRRIPYDVDFEDSPVVARAFEAALEAHDEILRVEPGHEKALMMKAALLFRRERSSGRQAALEILRDVQARHPENRQIASEIRRIERPCARCSDTGFCPHCAGRGTKRLLRMDRTCEACHGQGICLACGLL